MTEKQKEDRIKILKDKSDLFSKVKSLENEQEVISRATGLLNLLLHEGDFLQVDISYKGQADLKRTLKFYANNAFELSNWLALLMANREETLIGLLTEE